jgi:Na+-transporting NADH:ubiquinone oxidoreductase subunit F
MRDCGHIFSRLLAMSTESMAGQSETAATPAAADIKQYAGVVERVRDFTYDIKGLRIHLEQPDVIQFVPGQYLQLEVPPYGSNVKPCRRTYSICSPPSDNRCIELMIRRVPGGICTTWIFTLLKEGDRVNLRGPYGRLCLSATDRPMIWIAGGSGMAPFWSMIRDMRERRIQRPCTYFFGAVQRRDLFLLDEMAEIEKALPNFRFIPALSQPAPEDKWDGDVGLVTDVVARRVVDYSVNEFYLCGSGPMVDAVRALLEAKGVAAERMFFDRFR